MEVACKETKHATSTELPQNFCGRGQASWILLYMKYESIFCLLTCIRQEDEAQSFENVQKQCL